MANGMSYQEASTFIRENPKQADALAFESQEFFKAHPDAQPSDIPKSVLDGQEISEAYSYLREQHEDSQMREEQMIDRDKIPQGLVAPVFLAAAFLQKPKIMEDDRHYQQLEERLKNQWLKNHNAKDFLSKDGLDYLHGSIDDPTRTSLRKEAEEAFRNNSRFKNNIERYDRETKRAYKKQEDDPKWQAHEFRMQSEIRDRFELLEKRSKYTTPLKMSKKELEEYKNGISTSVGKKSKEDFMQNNPEKAKIYFERIDAERRRREEKAGVTSSNMPSSQGTTTNFSSPTASQTGQFPSPSFPSGKRGVPKKGLFKNPLKGLKKPFGFGKIGSKTAGRVALRGLTAFLLNPVVIALAFVIILTFVIVFSGAFGGIPGTPTTEIAPPIVPIETPTPTPPAEL